MALGSVVHRSERVCRWLKFILETAHGVGTRASYKNCSRQLFARENELYCNFAFKPNAKCQAHVQSCS